MKKSELVSWLTDDNGGKLTADQAKTLVEDNEFDTVQALKGLTEDGIVKYSGCKPGRAHHLKVALNEKFGTPAPQPPPTGLPTSIKLERDKAVQELGPAELLDILIGGDDDKKADAAEEYDSKANFPAIVLVKGTIDKDKSLECFRHVRSTRQPTKFWADNPVKPAKEVIKSAVMRDPIAGDILAAGSNPRTMTDWIGVSKERMALALWASQQGIIRNKDPQGVADELKQRDLNTFWQRIEQRLTAAEDESPGLKARLVKALTAPPEIEQHRSTFVVGVVDFPSSGSMNRSGTTSQDVMSREYQKALRKVMGNLSVSEQKMIAKDVGFETNRIDVSGNQEIVAMRIIEYANGQGQAAINRLVAQVMDRFPGYFPLRY